MKGTVKEVAIFAGGAGIARHGRSHESAGFIFDRLHDWPLLEQKAGVLNLAGTLQGWDMSPEFGPRRRLSRPGSAVRTALPPTSARPDESGV